MSVKIKEQISKKVFVTSLCKHVYILRDEGGRYRVSVGGADQALLCALNFFDIDLDSVPPGGYSYRVVTNDRYVIRLLEQCVATHDSSSPLSLEPTPSLSALYWGLIRLGVSVSYAFQERTNKMAATKKSAKTIVVDLPMGLGSLLIEDLGNGRGSFKGFEAGLNFEACVESLVKSAVGQAGDPILADDAPESEDEVFDAVEAIGSSASGPPKTRKSPPVEDDLTALDPVDEQSDEAEEFLTEDIEEVDFYEELEEEKDPPKATKNKVQVVDEGGKTTKIKPKAKPKPEPEPEIEDESMDEVEEEEDGILDSEDVGQVEKPQRRKPTSYTSVENEYTEAYWKEQLNQVLAQLDRSQKDKLKEVLAKIQNADKATLLQLCKKHLSDYYSHEEAVARLQDGKRMELIMALVHSYGSKLLQTV